MSSSPKIFSLHDVTLHIQSVVQNVFKSSFWVKAEINKLNFYKSSGHAFPELVEKKDNRVVAEMRSIIWSSDFQRIQQKFLSTLQEPLKDGIQVLMYVTIDFHPIYGLTLKISDMDPSFTLGELEREKLQNIEKLKALGLFARNKSLKLPLLPKRLAIISVETSKGFSDFMKVITQNQWGYVFEIELFTAILQGDKAVPTIIAQLQAIEGQRHRFDAVAIIRGGGGEVGLSCYNDFDLSKAICEFPLPVFSGIGHSTNETVAEMVSYRNAITPTELADFLLQEFHNFWVPLQQYQEIIIREALDILDTSKKELSANLNMLKALARIKTQDEKTILNHLNQNLERTAQQRIQGERTAVQTLTYRLLQGVRQPMQHQERALDDLNRGLVYSTEKWMLQQRRQLESAEMSIGYLDPQNLFRRGYSMTLVDGKLAKSVNDVREGQRLETHFVDGVVESQVVLVKSESGEDSKDLGG